jgi:hypothetical protein
MLVDAALKMLRELYQDAAAVRTKSAQAAETR